MGRVLTRTDYATLRQRSRDGRPIPQWADQFAGSRRAYDGYHQSYREYLAYEGARSVPRQTTVTSGSGGIDPADVMVGIVILGYLVMILDTVGVDLSVGEWL